MNSKFSKITQIYQIYQSLYEKVKVIGMNEQEKETHELQQYASDMLEHKNYETYFKMVKNGYQPTITQEALLGQGFIESKDKYNFDCDSGFDLIHKTVVFDVADSMVKLGYIPDSNTLANLLITTDFLLYNSQCVENLMANPQYNDFSDTTKVDLVKCIAQCLQNPSYQQDLYNFWVDTITSKNKNKLGSLSENGATETFKLLKNVWFTEHSLTDYKKIIKTVDKNQLIMRKESSKYGAGGILVHNVENAKYCLKILSEAMSENMSVIFTKSTDNVLEKIKHLYLNDAVDNMVVQSQYEKTKNYHIKNLPQQAQDIIMQIEKKYTRVSIIKNTLDAEKNFTVTNIMEQRLPEVVRKYFSIDDDYRTTLKDHEGKNATQLLIDSLAQIHSILNDVVQQANEDKLTKMTVDNRYMHAVKKSN